VLYGKITQKRKTSIFIIIFWADNLNTLTYRCLNKVNKKKTALQFEKNMLHIMVHGQAFPIINLTTSRQEGSPIFQLGTRWAVLWVEPLEYSQVPRKMFSCWILNLLRQMRNVVDTIFLNINSESLDFLMVYSIFQCQEHNNQIIRLITKFDNCKSVLIDWNLSFLSYLTPCIIQKKNINFTSFNTNS
jgi:hypothetical protein